MNVSMYLSNDDVFGRTFPSMIEKFNKNIMCFIWDFCKMTRVQVDYIAHKREKWSELLKLRFTVVLQLFYMPLMFHITMTSLWARWGLKSPAWRLFTQAFIQAQIIENIKSPRYWRLCGEFTCHRWIPHTKGQQRTENISIWWRHHISFKTKACQLLW